MSALPLIWQVSTSIGDFFGVGPAAELESLLLRLEAAAGSPPQAATPSRHHVVFPPRVVTHRPSPVARLNALAGFTVNDALRAKCTWLATRERHHTNSRGHRPPRAARCRPPPSSPAALRTRRSSINSTISSRASSGSETVGPLSRHEGSDLSEGVCWRSQRLRRAGFERLLTATIFGFRCEVIRNTSSRPHPSRRDRRSAVCCEGRFQVAALPQAGCHLGHTAHLRKSGDQRVSRESVWSWRVQRSCERSS